MSPRKKRNQVLTFVHIWGAQITGVLLSLVYAIQAFFHAHTQASVLDEGAYLMKGLLYATGRYQPFQDFGPLTNHMPLAFLIPGWAQVLFGPGLRTGRYLAVILGLLMLLGLWLLVRRLRGPWWASAAVAIIVFNPALIKMYSIGVSQVLVSCMLVWCMYFALGADRSGRDLMIASALAAAAWFTRINMAPVLLILLVYIYWQYGLRTAARCAAVGLGLMLAGHLLYWPGVLKLWAYWLPESVTPFLNAWRLPPEVQASWGPEIGFSGRLNSFLQAVRLSMVPVAAVVAGVVLWQQGIWKKNKQEVRSMVFLFALFAVLFVMHAGASLVGNYCVYCFQVYLGFFDVLAIVFFVLAVSYWSGNRSGWLSALTVLFIVLIAAGIGLAFVDTLPAQWLRPRAVRGVLDWQFFGGTKLWILIQNKYGLAYDEIVNSARRFLTQLIPVLGAVLASLLVLAAAWWAYRRQPANKTRTSFTAYAWMAFLAVAFLLTPTSVLGASYTTYDCAGDVIASYEAAGEVLAANVQPEGLVYWSGGESAVPLLYIPEAQILPPQLNGGYSFRIGGDTEIIHRLSYWDEPLRTRWLQEAAYLLIEDRYYDDFWVDTGDWVHLAQTPPVNMCREGAGIHILGRP